MDWTWGIVALAAPLATFLLGLILGRSIGRGRGFAEGCDYGVWFALQQSRVGSGPGRGRVGD